MQHVLTERVILDATLTAEFDRFRTRFRALSVALRARSYYHSIRRSVVSRIRRPVLDHFYFRHAHFGEVTYPRILNT